MWGDIGQIKVARDTVHLGLYKYPKELLRLSFTELGILDQLSDFEYAYSLQL